MTETQAEAASFSSSFAKNLDEDNVRPLQRILSGAGAAVFSAVIFNPLDVLKTRLQAQGSQMRKPPVAKSQFGYSASIESYRYKGAFDGLFKIIQQEGVLRLWRGTGAGLLLAVPTVGIYMPSYDIIRNFLEEFSYVKAPQLAAYSPLIAASIARALACIVCSPIELAKTRMQAEKVIHFGNKPRGMWNTLADIWFSVRRSSTQANEQGLRVLWTGAGAQLARDVSFSAICWATLEPLRRHLLSLAESEANVPVILGANFSAGVIAGGIAAAVTCPLDVAKTRRQLENPSKVIGTSIRKTLLEIWRDGKGQGLFAGMGPRVARAGPSVGVVVSFYEVLKYLLHRS